MKHANLTPQIGKQLRAVAAPVEAERYLGPAARNEIFSALERSAENNSTVDERTVETLKKRVRLGDLMEANAARVRSPHLMSPSLNA